MEMSVFVVIFYERFAQFGSVSPCIIICCEKKLHDPKGETKMYVPAPALNTSYHTHTDATMCFETVSLPALCGAITAMYPIYDQCRIELAGCSGTDGTGRYLWLYRMTMPVMFLTDRCAQRADLHYTCQLATPFTEDKMRMGCMLQADCSVVPHAACEVSDGMYRIASDAHISLFAACHAGCPMQTAADLTGNIYTAQS